ncbi:unnamed protein product [Linum tenue]|uniref:F-box domain-containing protein n=1 Tax=Linum tenue TaxID=586396 RepID=A0AAV0N240_9ROSI|nr:unnamed protein product [Linum tenue]
MATESCSSASISAASNVRLRSQTIRSEASPITNLEDDLLLEILIRLPNPKHSCRCKSVCKRWTSMISSPYFNRHFVSHHQSRYQPMLLTNAQLVIESILPIAAVPTDEADLLRLFVVWDNYKDLLLCGFEDLGPGNLESDRSYIVCNPFTKQWVALPLAPVKTLDYVGPCPRLVGEPRISSSATVNLDLGDGREFAYASEHRFRVACMYTEVGAVTMRLRLDLFCSESGEWTKDAMVLDFPDGPFDWELVSCNGELYCSYPVFDGARGRVRCLLAALHPFHLDDHPPTHYMDASEILNSLTDCSLTISQGALHLVATGRDVPPGHLTVWRLEEDGKSWKKQHEGLVNTASRRGNYKLEYLFPADLHPEKPEIVFLRYLDLDDERFASTYACNLTSSGEEIEFFAEKGHSWRVVQPKVSGWPTPIPRYEQLRGLYNGSRSCWVQSSRSKKKKKKIPPL